NGSGFRRQMELRARLKPGSVSRDAPAERSGSVSRDAAAERSASASRLTMESASVRLILGQPQHPQSLSPIICLLLLSARRYAPPASPIIMGLFGTPVP